jgi:hypothetical protein
VRRAGAGPAALEQARKLRPGVDPACERNACAGGAAGVAWRRASRRRAAAAEVRRGPRAHAARACAGTARQGQGKRGYGSRRKSICAGRRRAGRRRAAQGELKPQPGRCAGRSRAVREVPQRDGSGRNRTEGSEAAHGGSLARTAAEGEGAQRHEAVERARSLGQE